MSQQSRRPGRRNRPGRNKQKVRIESTAGELKIIIATSPRSVDGNVTLAEDIRLVRSALLYADTVELLSPGAQMIGSVAALGDLGPAGLMDIIAGLDDDTLRARGQDPDQMRAGLGWSQLSRGDRRRLLGATEAREFRQRVTSMLDEQRPGLDDVVDQIHGASGAEELELALERGVLSLAAPSASGIDMDEYAETLKALVSKPSSHLLFDEQISGLVAAMIKEGVVQPHRLTMTRAGQAVTGAGMVQRLRVFPDSTMASVLEARDELQDPLRSYRSATVELAGKLEAAPFDDDVQPELDDLWRNAVEPAVEKIRRDLAKTRLVRETVADSVTDLTSWVGTTLGSFLTMGVADLAPVPGLLIAGAGATALTATKNGLAAKDRTRAEQQLYYLYELERRL